LIANYGISAAFQSGDIMAFYVYFDKTQLSVGISGIEPVDRYRIYRNRTVSRISYNRT